jgi:hypothetical protein
MPQFVTIMTTTSGHDGVSINPEHVSSVENLAGATPPGSKGSVVTMSNGKTYEALAGC